MPVSSKRAWTEAVLQSRLTACSTSRAAASRRVRRSSTLACVDVERDTARAHEPAPEATATERRRHVEEVAPQPPAVRRGWQEPDVVRERSEVARVIREAFELEGDAAHRLRARGHLRSAESFEDANVRRRVANRRVAGERLHVVDRSLVRAERERALHSAVLVAERDLEVEDLLAVALKAEVSRLDDPGVHGADGHLVHLLALDAIEVGHAYRGDLVRVPPRGLKAHRLEPWVSRRNDAPQLGELALEQVHLGTLRGHRVERVRLEPRARELEVPLTVDGDHREEVHRVVGRRRRTARRRARDAREPRRWRAGRPRSPRAGRPPGRTRDHCGSRAARSRCPLDEVGRAVKKRVERPRQVDA